MPHPRTYADEDPLPGRVRTVCLELPEARAVEAWGRPTFGAGVGTMFAIYEDWDEVAELVRDSYRRVANQRQRKALGD